MNGVEFQEGAIFFKINFYNGSKERYKVFFIFCSKKYNSEGSTVGVTEIDTPVTDEFGC